MEGLMNTTDEPQLLDHSQLDAVSGGSIFSDVANAAAAVAGTIGGVVGGGPKFPIAAGISGAVKAGSALGHIIP